jgi:hypothetical protein
MICWEDSLEGRSKKLQRFFGPQRTRASEWRIGGVFIPQKNGGLRMTDGRGSETTRGCYNGRMLNIRNASANDIPVILQFIRELAEYEKAPEQAVATAEDLRVTGSRGIPNSAC